MKTKSTITVFIARAAMTVIMAMLTTVTAWSQTMTLTSESGEVTLQNDAVLTGTGGANTKVKIADGATVTLSGVDIKEINGEWPGIECLGNATIILAEGTTNNVNGGNGNPGIYVPEYKTLTINGEGSLNATGGS